MGFQPVNTDHSVTSALFQIVFTSSLPNSLIETMRSKSELWIHDLPAQNSPKAVNFTVDPDGSSVQESTGIEFAFLRPDGRPAWAFRAFHNVVMVECTRYTRWRSVMTQAKKYIRSFLDVANVSWPEGQVAQIVLAMSDDFMWHGSRDDFDLQQLMRPSSVMAQKSFASGSVWHSNAGWFDKSENYDTLQALNVVSLHSDDLCRLKSADARVNILHVQDCRFRNPVPVPIFADTSDDKFANVLEEMHVRNKELLREILIPDTATQIGLVQ
ncbi:MAG: TIGR04255 family protein [Pseudomonas sp.]